MRYVHPFVVVKQPSSSLNFLGAVVVQEEKVAEGPVAPSKKTTVEDSPDDSSTKEPSRSAGKNASTAGKVSFLAPPCVYCVAHSQRLVVDRPNLKGSKLTPSTKR